MSAAREAVFLPLTFLTVTLLGGLEPGASTPFTPPPLFALVLAGMIFAALIRSGALDPGRLLHASRPMLANANGAVVLMALFAASAQLLSMLTPRSGLPLVAVDAFLFVLLANTLVALPDRVRLLGSLMVTSGAAFVLKFVILAGLSNPDGGAMARVLATLFDAATLGTIAQAPVHRSAGYLAFFVVALYLLGVAALPPTRTKSSILS